MTNLIKVNNSIDNYQNELICEHRDCKSKDGADYRIRFTSDNSEPIFLCYKHRNILFHKKIK